MFDFELEQNPLFNIDSVGEDWIQKKILGVTTEIEHIKPSEFIKKRYLSGSEASQSGFMSLDLTPYWIDIIDHMDPFDDAREVIVKKGVKTSFNTTGIEGTLFYFAAFLKTFAGMFVTANKEMAQARVETNIIPMFQNSGFDVFQAADTSNANKTGKTKKLMQFKGGGWMVPEGAKNADVMRMWSVMYMWLDELDSFVEYVGKDGDPVQLLKDRCSAFWKFRKILMGSTPLHKGSSQIDRQFIRGDQQEYRCNCLKCGFDEMPLRWSHVDLRDDNITRGMKWDYIDGVVDISSIRYECWNCGDGHIESDKEKFINKNNAKWVETSDPVEPGIYSYHMPSALSYYQPWSKLVGMWNEAYHQDGQIKNVAALQVFYNNALGESFELIGNKLSFRAASGHRRHFYQKGSIPNTQIENYCKSGVMFLSMTVDVHDHALKAAIWGFTIGGNPWIIDYFTLADESAQGIKVIESVAWTELQAYIDEMIYVADDGKEYPIAITFIDAGDGEHEPVVADFCQQWDTGVYPIKGDSFSGKRIASFREFKTSAKTEGYLLAVDHYKDRMAPVLRRDWQPEFGDQKKYQLNCPSDITDKEIRELTREYKKEVKKGAGVVTVWHRPKNSDNELWDLLIYAMASLEVLAFNVCTANIGLDDTNWPEFWEICEEGLFFEAA